MIADKPGSRVPISTGSFISGVGVHAGKVGARKVLGVREGTAVQVAVAARAVGVVPGHGDADCLPVTHPASIANTNRTANKHGHGNPLAFSVNKVTVPVGRDATSAPDMFSIQRFSSTNLCE
jgi:hypothetical protein